MLVGFNTNVRYKDVMYHVQTEDSGLQNPIIITLLYHSGAILASKKVGYSHLVDDPNVKDRVHDLMKDQHQNMMRELVSGKYTGDEAGPPPEALEPQAAGLKKKRGLDEILMDFIIKTEG